MDYKLTNKAQQVIKATKPCPKSKKPATTQSKKGKKTI